MNTCPLCSREIPSKFASKHHLVPKLRGGKNGPVVVLCRSCHDKIHSVLTETELARNFASVDKLLLHPEIARFCRWIAKKPPSFQKGSRRLRSKKK